MQKVLIRARPLTHYKHLLGHFRTEFTAAIGWFDDYRTHRILEPVSNFWQLEVRKVMPLLSELHVTSYRLQCIYAKEMGLLR